MTHPRCIDGRRRAAIGFLTSLAIAGASACSASDTPPSVPAEGPRDAGALGDDAAPASDAAQEGSRHDAGTPDGSDAAPPPLTGDSPLCPWAPESTQFIPSSAHAVSAATDSANVQALLNAHGVLYLSPGDYRASRTIRLRSNQRLYGIKSTDVSDEGTVTGPIVIEAGASAAMIHGLTAESITFAPGALTKNDCVIRTHADVIASGATVEDSLFVGNEGALIVDDEIAGGRFKNNRMIAWNMYASTNTGILRGGPASDSGGNVFLSYQAVTPPSTGLTLDNLYDGTVVYFGAETWGTAGLPPAFRAGSHVGTLRVAGFNAGTASSPSGPFFESASPEVQLWEVAGLNSPGGLLPFNVNAPAKRLAAIDIETNIAQPQNVDVSFVAFTPDQTAADALDPTKQAILAAMVSPPDRHGAVPWERGAWGPVADPAGSNWAGACANKPDSTAQLQASLDTNKVTRLAAGIYCISQPLTLPNTHALIGAGDSKTAIIATSPSINIIEPAYADPNATCETFANFVLADITLYGGSSGVYLSEVKWGGCVGLNDAQLSHVVFREQSVAGFYFHDILGVDNNYWDHLAFVNDKEAMKQFTDNYDIGRNGEAKISYMDKTLLYQSQFLGNGKAFVLQAGRASGGDGCIYCLIRDTKEQVLDAFNNVGFILTNSELDDNSGDPVIKSVVQDPYDSQVFLISDVFNGGSGAYVQGPHVFAENVQFNGGRAVSSGTDVVTLYNVSSAVPLGVTNRAIVVESDLRADPALHAKGATRVGSTVTTFLAGAPNPKAQLLVGSAFGP